jgi:hypothetical protein
LGDKTDEEEGFDPGILFQEQRGNFQQGFEKVVAFSQVRLVFVGAQDFEGFSLYAFPLANREPVTL